MAILDKSKEAQERFKNSLITQTPSQKLQLEKIKVGASNLLNEPLRDTKDLSADKPTTFGGFVKSAVDWIPAGKVAEATGYALSAKYINKMEQDSIKTGNQLQEQLMRQVEANKKTGKDNTRLLEVSKQMGLSPVISEEGLKDAPTNMQIVASAVDAAAMMALGYKPALTSAGKIGVQPMSKQSIRAFTSLQKEMNAINTASVLQKSSGLTRSIIKTGEILKPTAKSIATGASFMALAELYMNRDATIQDVINSATLGAGIGMTIPVVSGLLGQTSKLVGKGVDTAWKKSTGPVLNKLREVAAGNYQALDYTKNPKEILNTINGYNKSLKEKIAKSVVDFVDGTGSFEQKWIDSNAPFKTIQENIFKARGKNMTDDEKLYYRIGMIDSVANYKGHKAIKELETNLKPFKNVEEELKSALLYSDYMDRGKLGQKTPGGKTLEENIAGFKVLMDGLTPEKRIEVGRGMQVVKDYVNKFIDKRVSDGLISNELAQTLKTLHPNYIPHKVILEEIGDEVIRYAKNSMNVSDSTVKKSIGSIRKIEDPITALKEMSMLVESTITRNRFLKDFVKIQKELNIVPGMKPLETADNILARIDSIRRMQELKPVRAFIDRAVKAGKKEYSEIAGKARDLMKKADGLLENASMSVLDDAVKNKEIKNLLGRYESTVKKFNETLLKSDYKASSLAALNDISKKFSSQVSELIEIVALNKKVKKELGQETINLFNNGKMETWVVPDDVASAIKGLDAESLPTVWKWIAKPQQIFKEFVTTKNISFAIKNKARDMQTAEVIGNAMIDEFTKKYGLSPKALNITKEGIMDLYKASGGYGASIFNDANRAMMSRLEETGMARFRKNLNPLELIRDINERMEIQTRVDVFQKALRAGLTPIDAAYVSRNAPIDFAKMGTSMRPVNQVIPFLNARVQGFTNIAKAVKNNPEAFFREVIKTTAYPAMVLQKHNMQFDSFKDISQDIKNRNWIIMYGEHEAMIDGQFKKVPQMFILPKGEAQQLVTGPLQYLMDRYAGIDKRGVGEMLKDTVGGVSPVSAANPFETSFFSQFGVYSIPIALATNKNLFYDSNILTEQEKKQSKGEQFKATTPNYIKTLTNKVNEIIWGEDAKIKGMSPAYVDFTIQSLGGLPQDISFLVSQIYDKSNNLDASKNPLTNSNFGALSQYPGFRGFMREDRMTQSSAMLKERDEKQKVEADEADISAYKNRTLDYHVNEMSKMDNNDDVKNYLKDLSRNDGYSVEDIEAIANRVISKRSVGTIRKSDSDSVKASIIAYQTAQMSTNEQKKEHVKELFKLGLIGDGTINELAKVLAGPGVLAIVDDLNGMSSNEQKKQYLKSLAQQGAIDDKTIEQIGIILKYQELAP